MESAQHVQVAAQTLGETQRLVEEMERLQLRAGMLMAEHRHVVAAMREVQIRLDAARERKA